MEPLMRVSDLSKAKSGRDLTKRQWMMAAQRQWMRDRPVQVKYLREKNLLQKTLNTVTERAVAECEALIVGNVPAGEAQEKMKRDHLFLPTKWEASKLPQHLAPYGQP